MVVWDGYSRKVHAAHRRNDRAAAFRRLVGLNKMRHSLDCQSWLSLPPESHIALHEQHLWLAHYCGGSWLLCGCWANLNKNRKRRTCYRPHDLQTWSWLTSHARVGVVVGHTSVERRSLVVSTNMRLIMVFCLFCLHFNCLAGVSPNR